MNVTIDIGNINFKTMGLLNDECTLQAQYSFNKFKYDKNWRNIRAKLINYGIDGKFVLFDLIIHYVAILSSC